MEIRLAHVQDIEGWMALVEQVREVFPGLETPESMAEHRSTALRFIRNSSGICAEDSGRILGVLLFSKESNTLCFLAVDPAFRKQHIAQKMVSFMLTQMPEGKDISVSTYREGDPNGIDARAFYKNLGFSESKLMEEFGYPVQEFILKRPIIR